MTGRRRGSRIAAIVTAMLIAGGAAHAQQKPSAAAMAMAREIIELKSADKIFQPLIPGVIEQSKNLLLQQNPMLQGELNQVAAELRTEYAPRQNEVMTEVTRVYASHFTEDELKQILAFYKSPTGKKVIVEEARSFEQSMTFARDWAAKFSEEVLAKFRDVMKKKGHQL